MSVARPLPHDAAALHVTGTARYVDDIPAPSGTLHLCFGLSAAARGRITGIELDGGARRPGRRAGADGGRPAFRQRRLAVDP